MKKQNDPAIQLNCPEIFQLFNFGQRVRSSVFTKTPKQELIADAEKCIEMLPVIGRTLRTYKQQLNTFDGVLYEDTAQEQIEQKPNIDDLLGILG